MCCWKFRAACEDCQLVPRGAVKGLWAAGLHRCAHSSVGRPSQPGFPTSSILPLRPSGPQA